MKKDSYIEKAEAAMAILVGAVLPGAYLVDIIPARMSKAIRTCRL